MVGVDVTVSGTLSVSQHPTLALVGFEVLGGRLLSSLIVLCSGVV
jgi:hypothetical protein